MNQKVENLIQDLASAQYFANEEIAYALMGAIELAIPLLVEGDPGVGKSSLAVATAKALNIPLIRLQCYEGITPESVLYDYDYQRQLLVVSAVRDKMNEAMKDMSVDESVRYVAKNVEFYGKDFLLPRPILRAMMENGRKVLLIDEIDKTNEEVEHTMLEALADFAVTVPELGTIKCAEENRPIVILTSNRYRNLSDAMKRRCSYLYIRQKDRGEIRKILCMHLDASELFCDRIAKYVAQVSGLRLQDPASIGEGIAWGRFILNMFGEATDEEIRRNIHLTAGYLAKCEADKRMVIGAISA